MTFTYSDDPAASPLDQVRFLIQDTTEPGLLQDEEIAWLLTQDGNPYTAAAQGCLVVSRKYAGRGGSRTIGDVSITYPDLVKQYADLAGALVKQAGRSSVPVPYLGGLSQGDKEINDSNLDHVRRVFPSDEQWANNNPTAGPG